MPCQPSTSSAPVPAAPQLACVHSAFVTTETLPPKPDSRDGWSMHGSGRDCCGGPQLLSFFAPLSQLLLLSSAPPVPSFVLPPHTLHCNHTSAHRALAPFRLSGQVLTLLLLLLCTLLHSLLPLHCLICITPPPSSPVLPLHPPPATGG